MDLNAVNIFIQVIECGSFTEAAQVLKITKSTVSRKLSELEEHLGVRLITRSTRSMILTPEGELFYQSGIRMLEVMDKAELELSANQDLIRGPIKVVMPFEVGQLVVGPLINQFLRLYPHVNVHLELTNRDVDVIAEGIDIYAQIGELEDSNLVSRYTGVSKRILVASPEYLAEFGMINEMEDLKPPHKIINIDNKAIKKAKWYLQAEDGTIARLNLSSQLTTNTTTACCNACIDGLGLAIMPMFFCDEHIKTGKLVHLLPELKAPDVPVSLIYAERKLMPKRKKLLIDYLVEQLHNRFD